MVGLSIDREINKEKEMEEKGRRRGRQTIINRRERDAKKRKEMEAKGRQARKNEKKEQDKERR